MSSLQVIPREMRANGKSVVVESDMTLVPQPTLEKLANTIRHEHELVVGSGRKMLHHAILAGGALYEAKKRTKLGEWQRWVAENTQISQQTANLYLRCSLYAETMKDAGVDSVTGAMAFLSEHNLAMPGMRASEEQIAEIRRLGAQGVTYSGIAAVVGLTPRTVKAYLQDSAHGTRKKAAAAKHRRRPGRKSASSRVRKIAITDDLIEGAAIKLREIFGPGGDPTDSDREAAIEILGAALTYEGPIPGESR